MRWRFPIVRGPHDDLAGLFVAQRIDVLERPPALLCRQIACLGQRNSHDLVTATLGTLRVDLRTWSYKLPPLPYLP